MAKRRVSSKPARAVAQADYPRHTIEKCLRIARAILDQNAGRPCTREKAAEFLGVGISGEIRTEISSAKKYGLLDEISGSLILPSELAKRILRPQREGDEIDGMREALLNAPQIKEVYQHYRGENLPEQKFFENTLVETFRVPNEKVREFTSIFLDNLKRTDLLKEHEGKSRILDIGGTATIEDKSLAKVVRSADIAAGDSCFVMMPFADPFGSYYATIYEPAIKKAGLVSVRADSEIFGTGKIIDQVLEGITHAKVLVAELTSRNPNVFYELGVAHALEKPVVLVSANEEDVPFDVRHIRVIYYDVRDPFWGSKLISKIAENIVSALKNPAEAVLKIPK